MRLLHPVDDSGADLSRDDLARLYAYPAEGGPSLRANFVMSADGAIQGPDHRSGTISDAPDQRLFAVLRSLADLVVCGAGTARAEHYRPVLPEETDAALRSDLGLAPVPAIAVVSRSLDLDPDLVSGATAPTIVITVSAAPPERLEWVRRRAPVIVAGEHDVDPSLALEALAAQGYRRMVCEGGATLMRSLLAAGVVDELTLTISPLLVSGDGLRLTQGPALDPPQDLQLQHLLAEGSTLFARYAVRSRRTTPATPESTNPG